MPARYLSDTELARLTGWPDEIADEDTVTYFTLSADDLARLAGFNREENRLGVAVQLATLPWSGWIPEDLAGCPSAALTRLGHALAIAPVAAPALLSAYGGWQRETRRRHRWRWCGSGNASCSMSFYSPVRWSTMHRACCCSWRATGCAPNGSSAGWPKPTSRCSTSS